jgi:hypothetical protein
VRVCWSPKKFYCLIVIVANEMTLPTITTILPTEQGKRTKRHELPRIVVV